VQIDAGCVVGERLREVLVEPGGDQAPPAPLLEAGMPSADPVRVGFITRSALRDALFLPSGTGSAPAEVTQHHLGRPNDVDEPTPRST
jgi:hypothetical protein